MKLPDSFTDDVATRFYDKEVNIIGETIVTEADGATNSHFENTTGTFKGNVRLTNFKQVQNQYGLEYKVDVAITCDTDVQLEVNETIEYAGIRYTVTDVLPFDSHKMIVGVKYHVS